MMDRIISSRFGRLLFLLCVMSVSFVWGQEKKLKVVTTMNYLRSLAEEIGGERVEAVALSNPKQDPHYVTPTPTMNQIAREADLFIEHGLSLDLWAANVVNASGNPKIQAGAEGHLVATINVPVMELPTEISRAWGDVHPQGNPHCWLDPINVRIIAENIAERLSALDPLHAPAYRRRLESFQRRIDEALFGPAVLAAIGNSAGEILARKARSGQLLEWLESKGLASKVGGWMAKTSKIQGAKVITYHKTYVYFAERFGLNIVAELEEKPGIPPPPKRRDAIVEQIQREQIRVILNDNFYSREAADYVASKTNAKVLVTYIDVGATDEITSYEKLISYLLESLTAALAGE